MWDPTRNVRMVRYCSNKLSAKEVMCCKNARIFITSYQMRDEFQTLNSLAYVQNAKAVSRGQQRAPLVYGSR